MVKTYLRTVMFTHQIHQKYSSYTDSRQNVKGIELFEQHGVKFDRNFPSLEAKKVN